MTNIINNPNYVLASGYTYPNGRLRCSSVATYCDIGDYANAGIGNMFNITKGTTTATIQNKLNDYVMGSAFNTIIQNFRSAHAQWSSAASRFLWGCTPGNSYRLAMDTRKGQVVYWVNNKETARY